MKVDARSTSIETLLKKWQYEIPEYQREYDWKEDELIEFWEDINENLDEKYFIWHMVFEGEFDSRFFKVIDWQQRITTITIILSVIRDLFYEKNETWLWDWLNDNFIFWKDKDNNEYVILNNKMPYPVLQKYVQNKLSEKDYSVKPTKWWEMSIINCYNFFKDILINLSIEELKRIRDSILNIEVIFVSVSDELDAFTIFETLNAKWKDLTPFDLIKNQIFKNYEKITTLDEPNDTWRKIKENINWNEINFLNNYWASRYKKVSDIRLYKEFIKESKQKWFVYKDFTNSLYTDSSFFNYIISPDISNWNNTEYQIFFSLNWLRLFNIKVSRSILLSLIREYKSNNISKNYLIKTLWIIEKFHFINNAVCWLRSSWLDTMYAKYSRKLYEAADRHQKHNILDELQTELRDRKPDKAIFENSFDEKIYFINSDTKNKKNVDYFLKRIEIDSNPTSILLEPSIEHLVPQSNMMIDTKNIKNIWNLFLVDSKINSKLWNKDFNQKKTLILSESTVKSTNDYILWLNNFDEINIITRRQVLIDLYFNY